MSTIKHTVVDPVLAEREAFPESSVFVRLGEQPRSVHKILSTEIFRDFLYSTSVSPAITPTSGTYLVPESDVASSVVDDRAELAVIV